MEELAVEFDPLPRHRRREREASRFADPIGSDRTFPGGFKGARGKNHDEAEAKPGLADSWKSKFLFLLSHDMDSG